MTTPYREMRSAAFVFNEDGTTKVTVLSAIGEGHNMIHQKTFDASRSMNEINDRFLNDYMEWESF